MNAKNWKIGMSSCCTRNITRETFQAYSENKIDLMEISLPHDEYKNINWKDTKAFSKEYGVGLWSFHLPFGPFEVMNIPGILW